MSGEACIADAVCCLAYICNSPLYAAHAAADDQNGCSTSEAPLQHLSTSTVRSIQPSLGTPLSAQEPGLVAAAEALWDIFAAHTATAEAAARMLQRKVLCPLQAATALGRTAWNAYSFNLDYRTGEGSIAFTGIIFLSWRPFYMQHFWNLQLQRFMASFNCGGNMTWAESLQVWPARI